ncbi:hypothetical protein BC936DRAFT_147196 [Jimgerdemannia flammicorona]|uniref:Uncharacterized protein n=1 Tax=Jimgerdemannia flammicorona TaxID=994334 RepID=A0A433D5W7_9FUNG|nr:hypothetical protein BC936DRAFT_147196 [Jimgerdemannia flammicorona]
MSTEGNLAASFVDIKQKCPAFQNGCPYANGKFDSTKCPAFEKGCPFANKSKEEINALLETVPKGHPACPVDETSNVMSSIKDAKQKCPAFSSGCPYATEGATAEVTAKCPAFGHGCPFHKTEETTEVPVAATGCPFMSGQMKHGDIGKCPVFHSTATTDAQHTHSMPSVAALKSMSVEELKQQCPAFKSGCPYANDAKAAQDTSKCPAFEKGCPFSHKSHEEIKELISNLPEGHPAVL